MKNHLRLHKVEYADLFGIKKGPAEDKLSVIDMLRNGPSRQSRYFFVLVHNYQYLVI